MIKIGFHSKNLAENLAGDITEIALIQELALNDLGKKLEKEMKRGIDEEIGMEPLSLMTIDRKGHSKILIDTGQMYDSIEWREDGRNITVGVHDDAPNDRAKIALTHEFGDPARGIPARPFIWPAWERKKRFYAKAMAEEIGLALRL